MTDIVVYGIPGSPYMRAALLALEEKGVAYQVRPLRPGEHRMPEHLDRHPFGRVPVFEHGDFRLYETQAILRYIDDVFPGVALQPNDPKRAARMNQLVGINDWYFFQQVGRTIVFNRVVAPRFGMPVNEEAVASGIPDARRALAEIDRLKGGGDYLAGDQLTIADLMLAPHMDMFASTNEGAALMAPHPALGAWLNRMTARPSMARTTWDALEAGCA